MSTLADLHEKLAAAAARSQAEPIEGPAEFESSLVKPVVPSHDPARQQAPQSRWLQNHWLAGGGVVAGGALLAIGYALGPLALAGALGLIAIAFAVTGIWKLRRATGEPSIAATDFSESEHDRLWEHKESASLLATIHDALGDVAVRQPPATAGRIVRDIFPSRSKCVYPLAYPCSSTGKRNGVINKSRGAI